MIGIALPFLFLFLVLSASPSPRQKNNNILHQGRIQDFSGRGQNSMHEKYSEFL
jgi:hypothetical protein